MTQEYLDLDEIVLVSEIPVESVKRVLYSLLALRYIKASFRARHKICHSAIGEIADSIAEAKEGPLDCPYCHGYVAREDIDVEILFKRLGG